MADNGEGSLGKTSAETSSNDSKNVAAQTYNPEAHDVLNERDKEILNDTSSSSMQNDDRDSRLISNSFRTFEDLKEKSCDIVKKILNFIKF